MKIYLGFNNPASLGLFERVGVKNVLFSYSDVRYGRIDDAVMNRLKELGMCVMVDSGAFMFFNKGIKEYPISYLDGYVNFVKDNIGWVDVFVVPDVIGDYEKSMKYAKYIVDAGVDIDKLIYVVHPPKSGGDYADAFKAIDAGFRYIGFSFAGKFRSLSADGLPELDKVYWDVVSTGVKTHFFGVTELGMLLRYMPTSCDSTTWIKDVGVGSSIMFVDGSQIRLFRLGRGGSESAFSFDVLDRIVGYGLEDMVDDFNKIMYALYAKQYVNIEKIFNNPELREVYSKMRSMSQFDEAFYRDLANYLYAVTQIEEVKDTPRRWINALNEYLSGYRYNVYDVVGKDFSAPSDNELIRVKIPFSSMCIHHLLPFYGHVIIEYRPSDRILGLSKFSRVVNVLSRRLQIQERLTKEIYDVLDDVLRPRELKVKVRAKHLCCRDRGVRIGSVFETEVSSSGSGDDREGKA
jgi:GTP cyclohydrolase I